MWKGKDVQEKNYSVYLTGKEESFKITAVTSHLFVRQKRVEMKQNSFSRKTGFSLYEQLCT